MPLDLTSTFSFDFWWEVRHAPTWGVLGKKKEASQKPRALYLRSLRISKSVKDRARVFVFFASTFDVISFLQGARALATDITERGARLFDLLGKERDVRMERSRVGLISILPYISSHSTSSFLKALRFLDAISGNLDSTAEHQYVEKYVRCALVTPHPLTAPRRFRSARELVIALKENMESLKKQCRDLEADEKGLDAKATHALIVFSVCDFLNSWAICCFCAQIKRKQAELERHEKRLKTLQGVRCFLLCVCANELCD